MACQSFIINNEPVTNSNFHFPPPFSQRKLSIGSNSGADTTLDTSAVVDPDKAEKKKKKKRKQDDDEADTTATVLPPAEPEESVTDKKEKKKKKKKDKDKEADDE